MSTLAHPISPAPQRAATVQDRPAHEIVDGTPPVGRPSDTSQPPGTVQTDAFTGAPVVR